MLITKVINVKLGMQQKSSDDGHCLHKTVKFMPRSVNSVASRARRKKILKRTRGNFLSRKNVWTVAKNTYEKGLTYAYRDRKAKKRSFRALWIQRINAAARQYGMTYSQFMGRIAKQNIGLNRKVLADLAMNNPQAFEAIINSVKQLLFDEFEGLIPQ